MQYTRDRWMQRHASRSDLTTKLTHLTKEASRDGSAIDPIAVLLEILKSKRLRGSTTDSGFICGHRPAVCFQDAPLYSIAQNIYFEQQDRKERMSKNEPVKVRYTPNGLLFDKDYLFKKGARPVFYDITGEAKRLLPKDQWWRIVNLDLTDNHSFVDWTHEREWRLPDFLDFELGEATIVLGKHDGYRLFLQRCKDAGTYEMLEQVRGIVTMRDLFY